MTLQSQRACRIREILMIFQHFQVWISSFSWHIFMVWFFISGTVQVKLFEMISCVKFAPDFYYILHTWEIFVVHRLYRSNPKPSKPVCKIGGSSCRSQQAQGGAMDFSSLEKIQKIPWFFGNNFGTGMFRYRRYHGVFLKQKWIDLIFCLIVYLICID